MAAPDLTSPYSPVTTVSFSTSTWILSDPSDNTIYSGSIYGDPSVKRTSNSTGVHVLGRGNNIVLSDTFSGIEFTLTFQSLTLADQSNLLDILSRRHLLVLRCTPYPYTQVRLTGDIATTMHSVGNTIIFHTQVTLVQVDG